MLAHPISLMKINNHANFQLSNLCLTTRARNRPYSEFRTLDRLIGPSPPWSQRREAKAIVKNVTVQPIKPVYVTLVFAWNLLAGILLLPQLQLLVCCIILPAVDLSAFLCNTVTS